jgi:hypothetical protein
MNLLEWYDSIRNGITDSIVGGILLIIIGSISKLIWILSKKILNKYVENEIDHLVEDIEEAKYTLNILIPYCSLQAMTFVTNFIMTLITVAIWGTILRLLFSSSLPLFPMIFVLLLSFAASIMYIRRGMLNYFKITALYNHYRNKRRKFSTKEIA